MAAALYECLYQLLEVMSPFSMEIIIFGTSMFFAFALKQCKESSVGKVAVPVKVVEEHWKSPPSSFQAPCRSSSTAGRGVGRSPDGQSRHCAGPPHVVPATPRPRVRPQLQCPAQIIDEVVSSVKEHHSMKAAGRAIELYSQLRALMAATPPPAGPSLKEVARGASHELTDFYTTVTQCAIRVARFDLVEPIIEDMRGNKVERTLAFYELVMKMLASQKQYRLALAIYDCLDADGLVPSVVTWSCLIGFAAEVGEPQRALDFFQLLAERSTPSIRVYMQVLRLHAKRHDWPSSLATFRDLQSRGVRPDSLVLNIVLATAVTADKIVEAEKLVIELSSVHPRVPDIVSYNTLVKGYAQRGDVHRVTAVIKRMLQDGLEPNAITFNTAMDAGVRGGDTSAAWSLLGTMRNAGLSPDKFTCSILVKGLAKQPTVAHLRSSLDLLAEAAGTCDQQLLATLYHGVLDACFMMRDTELAAHCFSDMRQRRIQPSAAAQRQLLKALPRGAEAPHAGLQG